ncbi:MAG: Zn-ribbon containing protein [Candidatus Micrarchaeia archaeon]
MHICLKCGRSAKSVEEIEEGCTCGSKVFVFKRDEADSTHLKPLIRPGEEEQIFAPEKPTESEFSNEEKSEEAASELPLEENENASLKNEGEFTPSGVASAILSDEPLDDEPGHDYCEVWLSKGAKISKIRAEGESVEQAIENIRQVRRGIFEVDLLGLKEGPLVVRDQEGVYYVRLPFAHPELDEI